MKQTYTVKELAEILGYSTNSIYSFLKEGRIKSVRVGQGKFHIPQEEVDRLLGTRGKENKVTASKTELTEELPKLEKEPMTDDIWEMANFFDWFIAAGSIILGLSFSLFSRVWEGKTVKQYDSWIAPMVVLIITSSIGLIVSNLAGKKYHSWHRLFYLILILIYSSFTMGMVFQGDLQAVFIFGSLTVILLLKSYFRLSGRLAFILYVLSLFFSWVVNTALNNSGRIFNFSQNFSLGLTILGGGIITFLVLTSLTLWFLYQHKQRVFYFILDIYGIALVGSSIYFANQLSWTWALFLLFTATMIVILPWWESIQFGHKQDRRIFFLIIIGVLSVFMIMILAIRITQRNIIELTTKEVKNDVEYGTKLVGLIVDSVETAVKSSASNPVIVESLEEKEFNQETMDKLRAIFKTIYESNSNLSRLMILDHEGNVIINYPWDLSAEKKDFAFQPYFQQAIKGENFLSDISETEINQKELAVVAASPLINKDNQIVGVLTGSIDLKDLGGKLQEAANADFDEYFTLTNKIGNYIYHPNSQLIMTPAKKNLQLSGILNDQTKIIEDYDYQGAKILQAYKKVPARSWILTVQVPIVSILRPTKSVLMIIYISIVLIITAIIFFFVAKNSDSHQK